MGGVCGVAWENRNWHGTALKIEGKQVLCKDPAPFALVQWVQFRYGIEFGGAQPIFNMCLSCYQQIYGDMPQASGYGGDKRGRFMTQDIEDKELAAAAENYTVNYDLPVAPAAVAPAAVAPAAVVPMAGVKPPLERQGAQLDLLHRRR
jgi:hypothetical protein